MSAKQKLSPVLACAILAATIAGVQAMSSAAQNSGSRSLINASFIAVAFAMSSGVLASALVVYWAFEYEPTLPEFPLWIKISSYYAAFMAVWAASFLFFSGETPEQRAARWELGQASDPTLIHTGMVVIGLIYIAFLWLIPSREKEHDNRRSS